MSNLRRIFFLLPVAVSLPNIVLILTDDQSDSFPSDFEHMKTLTSQVMSQGLTISDSFTTTPVCCPSRSSLHTGMYISNIGVTNNSAGVGGCGSLSFQSTAEKSTLSTHLKELGYRTSFGGKYLNNYGLATPGSDMSLPQCSNMTYAREKANMDEICGMSPQHVPPGWDEWNGLAGNSKYYNYTLSHNGVSEVHGDNYHDDYLVDLVKNRTVDFILGGDSRPFFSMLSVPAAHEPADPAPQHADYGPDLKAPRTPNFNVPVTDGRHQMMDPVSLSGDPFNSTVESFVDLLYRRRMAALQSVDDMIRELLETIDSIGALDDTIIMYTSDNGYHLGQHALPLDKRQMYETDIRVPMIVRGPGINQGVVKKGEGFALNIDITPTLLGFAGADDEVLKGFDGRNLAPMMRGEGRPDRTEFLIEYNGENVDDCSNYLRHDFPEGNFETYDGLFCQLRGPHSYRTPPKWNGTESWSLIQDSSDNTYQCIRSILPGSDMQYCEWINGEVEAYDLIEDPWNMVNLATDPNFDRDTWHQRLVDLQEKVIKKQQ